MRGQNTLRVKWRASVCFASDKENEIHMEWEVFYCVV